MAMVMRVEHVNGEYKVVIPFEALEELHLHVGTQVEVRPVPDLPQAEHRMATDEEAREAFTRFEKANRQTFLELAK